jgi:hypothetical protein
MSYENYIRPVSMIAGQDFTNLQYRFISIAQDDGQVDPTGYGLESEGVIQNKPSAAGRVASVMSVEGCITKCVAGGVVRPGKDVMSDAVGRCIEATAGGRVQGVNMAETASAAGDIVAIMLKKGGAAPQVTTTTTTTTTSSTTTTTA